MSQTADPSAGTADPLTTVSALVLRPQKLEFRSSDGAVVTAIEFMGSASDAVAKLTTVFRGAPVDESHAGSNHFPPFTTHTWDGFQLQERF